ncbi:amino acid adenylation domain-containing protein [Amycolatopsis mediterranei S699]|uniref:Amino acid adenylation domain-containing protein n=3 Tax=Amycolatopsis mediterranei TaxID=33910 RepID=A0A0H3D6D2_AMYMU|nr:non-ribosomal peptide synthetase [Amycolatopsis mediterranei]ADJ46560.1 amino acid adenylation domain-containing protein [Amycolatopsis mediterranei U32]AFO78271.1 amino acid adenylation domain-containing protein [Amycolatopsis mediterranei S699]AGT85399.1 amino acid adenylation domain-containing protein [Amycolatopsis mediterranei RB]KDO11537.1 amino acid adenylation protein [Amycolatopsis mediterranei]KDU90399.1 amino acid adenylation protein [Amycolatopsis mediterranei]
MTTLDRLIAAQAARTPDAQAVVDARRALTYRELDELANATAARLKALGVGPEVRVGVVMDRAVEMVVAVLAVLRAGGAYVPVEPDSPDQRVADTLDIAGARITLTQPSCVDRMVSLGQQPVLVAATGSPVPVSAPTGGDNLAAVYCTSGSTGRPKGVGCPHTGWINRMRWMQDRHDLQPGETVLHKTTLTFDDAAVELFWPLMHGGRVAVLEPGAHRDPRAIIDAAVKYRVVHLQFVPSVLDLFLDALTDDDMAGLASLRSALSSGEALRPITARRFSARFGDTVELDNTWGVTEASIDSTHHRVTTEDGLSADESVPIGTDMTACEVRVRDARLDEVPAGEIGELCIGGEGLARGYLGDPRRTALAFVPAPGGRRVYRTGDRAVRRADGTITFLGRVDNQVKIRGVRVELGEVEAALVAHPAVLGAAVVAVPAIAGGKQLAAYVVAEPKTTGADLRAYLGDHLTSYAIPSTITFVAALPLLASGKVDRNALTAVAPTAPEEEPAAFLAPRTTTEETVAAIWCAVLGLDRVSIDRDFLDAGGHSLLAVRVLSRLRQAYELNLPIKLIFEYPTVQDTAARIEQLLLADLAEVH